MSLSQETIVELEGQGTPWVPSKKDIHWPMKKLSYHTNDLLICKFDVPVDENNWTCPLLKKEAGMVNQNQDAFFEVINLKNMKCAKRVIDSFLEESHEMNSHYAYNPNFGIIEKEKPPVTNKRKELLDVFDEMDFHDAYKSIIDIEQSLFTNKRKQLVDEDVVCVHRIHWFMATAVSYLILQYGEDIKENDTRNQQKSFNVFDVLRWHLFKSPFHDYDPLDDTELDTLLENKYSNGYSRLLSIKEMKARAIGLHQKANHQKGFSLEDALIKAENRDLLLSLYRLSSIYYSLRPGYFSNTMENYPLFWQIYAEIKGRIVIASDYGFSKFFVPFGFEGALMNYCSTKVLRTGEFCYSAKQLAQSPIGVESFFCSVYESHLRKDKNSLVFWPVIKKISSRSLKLSNKELGKPNDNKIPENDKMGENEAYTEKEESSSKEEKANIGKVLEKDKLGEAKACTEEEDLSSNGGNTIDNLALESNEVDVAEASTEDDNENQYKFFLRLV